MARTKRGQFWTDLIEKNPGINPEDLADLAGSTLKQAQSALFRRGKLVPILPLREKRWMPRNLGQRTDAENALRLGISVSGVAKMREARGILAAAYHRKLPKRGKRYQMTSAERELWCFFSRAAKSTLLLWAPQDFGIPWKCGGKNPLQQGPGYLHYNTKQWLINYELAEEIPNTRLVELTTKGWRVAQMLHRIAVRNKIEVSDVYYS